MSPRRGTRRNTVALVSHSCDLAGAERCLLRLALGLHERGLHPLVIVPPGPSLLADALHDAGIDVSVVQNQWWTTAFDESDRGDLRRLAAVARSTWQTYRVLRESHVEVVGTASSVIPEGALAARLAGARHVWHVRELYPTDVLRPILGLDRMLRLIERLSSAVLVPSQQVGRLFGGSSKVHVVPEGIDRAYFDEAPHDKSAVRARFGIAESDPAMMLAGTIEPGKNQLMAVKVLGRLAARGVAASLILCGSDTTYEDYRREIASAAEELGVKDRVHFLGFQRELLPLYDAADILLVASQRESFGLTIVEAMARGVPVVSTRCGGPEELVVDGETGYLVDTDDADSMADRVLAILSDAALRARFGSRGRARAGDYHPDANLARTLAGYGLPVEN